MMHKSQSCPRSNGVANGRSGWKAQICREGQIFRVPEPKFESKWWPRPRLL